MILPYALALTAGTLPVALLAELPPRPLVLIVMALAVACLRQRRLRLPALVLIGLGHALIVSDLRLHPRLDPLLAGQDIDVRGVVTGLPDRGERGTRFRLRVERAEIDGREVVIPPALRLNRYGVDPDMLAPGQAWALTVRLRQPRGMNNPGGFDYERWLFQEGIGATGHVRPQPAPVMLAAAGISLDGVRDRLRREVAARIADPAYSGLVNALAVGDRSAISSAQWETLLITGTNHLIAISGLHVGLAALFGLVLGRLAWRLVPGLRWRVARPVFAACGGLACAVVYAGLAGFAIPTQRALAMLAAGLGMVILRRRARPDEVLGLAMFAVVLLDPLSTLAPGFWLSFAAVGAILGILAGRLAAPGHVETWLRLQFAIALALLPILLLLFTRTSIIGPVANLVAVPWVSTLVVPPTLAGTVLAMTWPALAELPLTVAHWALVPLWAVLETLAALPGAEMYRPAPALPQLLLALAGVCLLLLPRGMPGRGAGLACMLPLLFVPTSAPAPGNLWIEMLDVGPGSAIVLRTHRHVLIYGSGPRLSRDLDAGASVLVPYLRQEGIRRVDLLVLPSGRNAQAGGAASVMQGVRVRRVMAAGDAGFAGAAPCRRGDEWVWDDIRFRVLHPAAADSGLDDGDASCVLRVEAAGGSILLPGDLARRGLWTLLTREPGLTADLLVAPRQGSRQSLVPAFAATVAPAWLLVPGGTRHAGEALLDTYDSPRVIGTQCAGAVRFRLERNGGIRGPRGWSVHAPRFWRSGCS